MNTIEKLLRFHHVIENQKILFRLANLLAKSSPSFCKNARFGKFLLGLMKKLPSSLSPKVLTDLKEAVDGHATFLKKNIDLELKKKTVKET